MVLCVAVTIREIRAADKGERGVTNSACATHNPPSPLPLDTALFAVAIATIPHCSVSMINARGPHASAGCYPKGLLRHSRGERKLR